MTTTTVYLLHFPEPYRHARHDCGSTGLPLEDRLAQHHAGHGSKLTRAAAGAGVTFEVARTWPGSKQDERRMKGRIHGSATSWRSRCPLCRNGGPPAA